MINDKVVTNEGFGECLRAGLEATIIRVQGENIAIRLDNGDVWHGKISDVHLKQPCKAEGM